MSNFTVEELKNILLANGVELPSGRLKKEDYLKLYTENISLNASLGETYASDDEGSQNSRRVTSTNGENGSQNLDFVEQLSNDELFNQLKQLDFNPGPILANTRKVYEKKLMKLLSGESSVQTNGHGNNSKLDISELSDNEVDIPGRNATPQPGPSKREASREPSVVKVNAHRGSREPSLLKSSSIPSSSRESSIHKLTTTREGSVPRRTTYIEKIPRGSSQRIIENIDSEVRQRHKVNNAGDGYIGRWSPRISSVGDSMPKEAVPEKSKKNLIIFIIVLLILISAGGFIYSQWTATDPYKLIEKDAEDIASRKIDY